MTLDDFENSVEPQILARGRAYYQDSAIKNVVRLAPDEISAVAYGTSRYNLRLKLQGRELIEWRCSCPYDWGDICKHMVALCFYLRQHGNTGPDIKLILQNASEAALRRFLAEQMQDDGRLRHEFLRAFGPEDVAQEDTEGDDDDEWDDDENY
jgi:uncharacterized Zn finger protein